MVNIEKDNFNSYDIQTDDLMNEMNESARYELNHNVLTHHAICFSIV